MIVKDVVQFKELEFKDEAKRRKKLLKNLTAVHLVIYNDALKNDKLIGNTWLKDPVLMTPDEFLEQYDVQRHEYSYNAYALFKKGERILSEGRKTYNKLNTYHKNLYDIAEKINGQIFEDDGYGAGSAPYYHFLYQINKYPEMEYSLHIENDEERLKLLTEEHLEIYNDALKNDKLIGNNWQLNPVLMTPDEFLKKNEKEYHTNNYNHGFKPQNEYKIFSNELEISLEIAKDAEVLEKKWYHSFRF